MNMATIRMELCIASPAVETLELTNQHGTIQLPIEGQHVRVPYPWVKRPWSWGGPCPIRACLGHPAAATCARRRA
jgi:hypothetical protein